MKPAAASSNWTSRKRNEKLERFWQTAIAAASSSDRFRRWEIGPVVVGFLQQASHFLAPKQFFAPRLGACEGSLVTLSPLSGSQHA
jgi:hypothetical protein